MSMNREKAVEVLKSLPVGLLDLNNEQKWDLTEAIDLAIDALAPSNEALTIEQLTIFFSVFVFLQFWNMFNAKGFEACHSVLHDLKGSRTFFLVLLFIAVGQIVIVEWGGAVFRTTPLSLVQWIEVIGYTSLIAILGDIVRTIRRCLHPRSNCRK